MSTEFFPTKMIFWSEFCSRPAPEGISITPNPNAIPGKGMRVTDGTRYATAWQNRGPVCKENDDGTHFELFGASNCSENGGVLLAAIAKHWGVRLVSEFGELVGPDGNTNTGIWDDLANEGADQARGRKKKT